MTTWILLRGLTRESRHWNGFPQRLQARMPDADIHAIDLPGCGGRNADRSPSTIERIAADCREEALARGLTPPFRLLAISLGGMVAVAWAHDHPDEVAGCVLINSSMRPFSPFHRRLRPRSYPGLLKMLLPIGNRRREETVLRLTSARAGELGSVLAAWTRYRDERPVSLNNALRQLAAAARYLAPAAAPAMPLLILAASRDLLVDPACSRSLASAWHDDFAEHPTAGHDLPLDDGEWVAARVAEWYRRTDLKLSHR